MIIPGLIVPSESNVSLRLRLELPTIQTVGGVAAWTQWQLELEGQATSESRRPARGPSSFNLSLTVTLFKFAGACRTSRERQGTQAEDLGSLSQSRRRLAAPPAAPAGSVGVGPSPAARRRLTGSDSTETVADSEPRTGSHVTSLSNGDRRRDLRGPGGLLERSLRPPPAGRGSNPGPPGPGPTRDCSSVVTQVGVLACGLGSSLVVTISTSSWRLDS